jgi:hypothetical protein
MFVHFPPTLTCKSMFRVEYQAFFFLRHVCKTNLSSTTLIFFYLTPDCMTALPQSDNAAFRLHRSAESARVGRDL